MSTFGVVTRPKTDDWLVQSVGALIAVTSVVLLRSAISRQISTDTLIVGAGSAVVLMFVDLLFVSQKIISRIYLGDAALEFIFLAPKDE
jgi:hypothetical protein